VLILLPARPLVAQYQHRLQSQLTDVPVLAVDRRSFRALQTRVPIGATPWPAPAVVLLPIDTAKQEDIAESLIVVAWDLVIVDEAHFLSGPQRNALLERIVRADRVRRMLLMTATQPTEEVLRHLPGLSTTTWTPDALRNWDGTPLIAPIHWQIISYERGADEVRFLRELRDTRAEVERASGNPLLWQTLVTRASSSTYAVEQTLQRLDSALREQKPNPHDMMLFPEDMTASLGEGPPDVSRTHDPDALLTIVGRLLETIDAVTDDQKLNALLGLLKSQQAGEATDRTLLICSQFVDTICYLDTALREAGYRTCTGTGVTRQDEFDPEMAAQNGSGKVVLVTLIGAFGLDLPRVSTVVFYDSPNNRDLLAQWRERILGIAQPGDCTWFAFQDRTGVLAEGVDILQGVAPLAAPPGDGAP
jgi:superfamily II DNA or RNA helicase